MCRSLPIKFSIAFFVFMIFLTLINMSGAIASQHSEKFDHFATGFPLTGQHFTASCESCHIKGIFKGTPTSCNNCHNDQTAPGKHAKHIISDNICDNCHTTFSWDTASVDHTSVIGSCSVCHNGSNAAGKPASHIFTTAECDACHGTVSWVPASFNHDNVTGRCGRCHNGKDATGKHATHLSTTQDCTECHNTVSWAGANFNHSNITGRCDACHRKDLPRNHIPFNGDCGDCHSTNTWATAGFNHDGIGGRRCDSCHNGQDAPGKHGQHILTSDDCGSCHITTAWIPANFDHSRVVGSCNNCHINDKPNNHFITSQECNTCHNTTNWLTTNFIHSSGNYPGDHQAAVDCINCHTSNSEIATWNFPAYKPDCAGCHQDKYKQGAHKHIVNGQTVFYSVSELRNCAGSCHKEDKLINQKHRTTKSSW